MEGKILHYNKEREGGIILGSDGNRFNFAQDEWKAAEEPRTGMAVDFVDEDNNAKEIYATTALTFAQKPATALAERVGHWWQKAMLLFTRGIHNKKGVGVSVALLFTLFLPAFYIPLVRASMAISDSGMGNVIIVAIAVLAILFYGGASRVYIKAGSVAVVGLLCYQYYSMYDAASQLRGFSNLFLSATKTSPASAPSVFHFMRWGVYLNIIMMGLLLWVSFKFPYKENPETI